MADDGVAPAAARMEDVRRSRGVHAANNIWLLQNDAGRPAGSSRYVGLRRCGAPEDGPCRGADTGLLAVLSGSRLRDKQAVAFEEGQPLEEADPFSKKVSTQDMGFFETFVTEKDNWLPRTIFRNSRWRRGSPDLA